MSTYIYSTAPSVSVTSPATNTMLNSGVTLTVPGNITTTSTTASSIYTTVGSNGMSYQDIKPHTLHVQGNAKFEQDAEFSGNITVKGVDLAEAIKNIESRLNILRPNHKLESEWDELRELGEQYRQLERNMLEKLEMVELLKKKY